MVIFFLIFCQPSRHIIGLQHDMAELLGRSKFVLCRQNNSHQCIHVFHPRWHRFCWIWHCTWSHKCRLDGIGFVDATRITIFFSYCGLICFFLSPDWGYFQHGLLNKETIEPSRIWSFLLLFFLASLLSIKAKEAQCLLECRCADCWTSLNSTCQV